MRKTKELHILLGFILLVFIMNFMVFRLAYLKEPVFLTHALTARQGDTNWNSFYYITNKDDHRTPIWAYWSELGEDVSGGEPFWCMEESTHGAYSVRTFALTYDFLDQLAIQDTISLKQLVVEWSDGTQTLADIGELCVFGRSEYSEEGWNGVGNGFRESIPYESYQKIFPEDVTLTGVTMPLQETYGDLLTVMDEKGKEIVFPLAQKKNDTFYMQTQFVVPKEDARSHMVLALKPVLEGVRADGTPMVFLLDDSAQYVPDWSFIEIYRILHMKGAV